MKSSVSIRGVGKGKELPEFLRELMDDSPVRACGRRKTDLLDPGHDSQSFGNGGSPLRGGERETG